MRNCFQVSFLELLEMSLMLIFSDLSFQTSFLSPFSLTFANPSPRHIQWEMLHLKLCPENSWIPLTQQYGWNKDYDKYLNSQSIITLRYQWIMFWNVLKNIFNWNITDSICLYTIPLSKKNLRILKATYPLIIQKTGERC